ncbi:hypothetical protein SAMN05216287_3718 [Pseudomonas kuykendallii]|uniref:Uncharacterized protein n=1 Tax=Pseudomonas kuykendallii TaxID=1007099 RepID=A0A1H3EIC2_9PSED|nr:hypothetical protein SAMN05216287_3718 [Pseudomonas kuykendallii]
MGYRVIGATRVWSSAVQDSDGIKAFVMLRGRTAEQSAAFQVTRTKDFASLVEAECAAAAIIDQIAGIEGGEIHFY